MIRLATQNDLEQILEIYAYARNFMKETGNPDQWGESYPPKSIVLEDIKKEQLYVLCENEQIGGVFVYFFGLEPEYEKMCGAWQKDGPSGVIHRVAKAPQTRGFLTKVLEFVPTGHIRIDTSQENTVMQSALEKNGFKKCGEVKMIYGATHLVYERI